MQFDLKAIIFMLAMLGLSSWGLADSNIAPPNKDLLIKRVKTYWKARADHDFKKSLGLEAPYIQFLTPFKVYRIYLAKTVTPLDVQITYTHCTQVGHGVSCIVTIKPKDADVQYIREEWIYFDKNWYHIIKDPIVFSNCFPP